MTKPGDSPADPVSGRSEPKVKNLLYFAYAGIDSASESRQSGVQQRAQATNRAVPWATKRRNFHVGFASEPPGGISAHLSGLHPCNESVTSVVRKDDFRNFLFRAGRGDSRLPQQND